MNVHDVDDWDRGWRQLAQEPGEQNMVSTTGSSRKSIHVTYPWDYDLMMSWADFFLWTNNAN